VNHDHYDDSYIRGILNTVKNVAIVGASANESRPSLFVTKYLAERGYNVFPINPGRGGEPTGGLMTYAKLAGVPERIDMVDVFRRSEDVPKVLDEVLALPNRPMVFWLQQGVRNDEAAAKAEAAGMKVVMNRCPKIEYGRLSGEIGWVGVNSRTISSKRQQRIPGGVQRLRLDKE
jgi:predicted CoA-binding protein